MPFNKKDYAEAGRLTLMVASGAGLVIGLPVAIFKAFNIPEHWQWVVSSTGICALLIVFGVGLIWRAIQRVVLDPPIDGFNHLTAESLKGIATAAVRRLKARQSSPISMGAGLAVKYALLEIIHAKLNRLRQRPIQIIIQEMAVESVKDGKLLGNQAGFKRIGSAISQLSNDLSELLSQKTMWLKWLELIDPLLPETKLVTSLRDFCDQLDAISNPLTEWGSLTNSAFEKRKPEIIQNMPRLQESIVELQQKLADLVDRLYQEMNKCEELAIELQDR